VRDLLIGYMSGVWLAQADFSTLDRFNASYVSETERQRHDDMVWRLKVGTQWVWVYLLLEFQSEPGSWIDYQLDAENRYRAHFGCRTVDYESRVSIVDLLGKFNYINIFRYLFILTLLVNTEA